MVCAACRAENREGAKFCNECGAALTAGCPECGASVRPRQRFCDECGAALPASAAPVAPGSRATGESGGGPASTRGAGAPELRLVSVLFVDLVGFTTLSEGRAAEDVRELLGRYFDVARGIVERYGGTIEKFIGDAVMAGWGAPVTREDDAERAVRAALEIVDAVSEFGVEVGAPDLRARAGVVTGQAAAVDNPSEGIVAGDRVNTASRVQSAAEPGTVLVDEVTRQVASAAILFEDAGEHTVKGKAEPLQLSRAVRVVAGVGGREREQLLEAPFVGRDREFRLVKELLDATVERGGARLVAVSGEAGIGKSRLRRELSNYVDGLRQSFLWHTGRCLAHGDGVAYWALAEMVRQRLGIPEDAPTADAVAKLDAGLLEWIVDQEEREYIRPRLGALIGVGVPGLDRAELLAGWRLFFERLAAHNPVVLVFEDMQWADDGLLAFIDLLLDWSRAASIFILTLARPELAAEHDGWPAGRRGVTAIDLEPLPADAVAELLDGAVQGLPVEVRDRIVAQAQGNPLYAIETIRSLADRGSLELVDGRLVASGDVGELETPASLSALLASRLDALDPAERDLVKAVSVFGGSFPLDAVVALAGESAGEVETLLASLVRKQVFVVQSDPLSPDRGQYAFAQGLLRSVAYDTLGRRARKQLHLRAAEHVRVAFANEGEDVAELIANHILEAFEATSPEEDDHESLRGQAVEALKRSAERSEAVGAPLAGSETLARAAELAGETERPELLQDAGRLASVGGSSEQALLMFDQARQLFLAAGRAREAAATAGLSSVPLIRLGRHGDGIARLEAAIKTVEEQGDGSYDPDLPVLQWRLSRLLMFSGEFERADRLIDRALVGAQALGLGEATASALGQRASLYGSFLGRPAEAEGLFRQAIELTERHGSAQDLAVTQGNFAEFARVWNRPGARQQAEESQAADRRRGDIGNEAIGIANLGDLYVNQGLWEQAEALSLEFLAREAGEPSRVAYASHPLLQLHALRGRRDAAGQTFAGLAPWENGADSVQRCLYATAAVLLATLDRDVRDVLAEGLALLEQEAADLGDAPERVSLIAWPAILDAALELEDREAVQRIIGFLADRPPGHMPPMQHAHLARGRGLVAAHDGDHEPAERHFRDAAAQFDQIEFVYWRAVSEVDLADVLLLQGRGGEAPATQERAIATLEPLAAEPVLRRAHALAAKLAPAAVLPDGSLERPDGSIEGSDGGLEP